MKKVLVLTVIAILALGVMALANTAGYNEIQDRGPTCSSTEITVHSVIGIEQGYVATATSYNASFCGATGNPLTDHYTSADSAVLLAQLTVQSNMSTISVAVSHAPTTLPHGMTISYYNNGSSWTSSNPMVLTGGSYSTPTPWSGTLDVVSSDLTRWANAAGQTTIAFTFTISPANTY